MNASTTEARSKHRKHRKLRVRALMTLSATVALLLIALSGLTVLAHRTRKGGFAQPKATSAWLTQGQSGPSANQSQYVRRTAVWPKLQETLRLIGDRMEKPGKERLVMTGVIRRGNDEHPFRLITEYPDKMRLEETGGQPSTLVFNGNGSGKSGGSLSQEDEDLIECLAFDSIDHLFSAEVKGVGLRSLGEHFRLDNGKTTGYGDGYYDIYVLSDMIDNGRSSYNRNRLYYINSDTLSLSQVAYDYEKSGVETHVEARLGNWRKENGQLIPHSITRFENGKQVIQFVITGVSIGPGAKDGAFDRP